VKKTYREIIDKNGKYSRVPVDTDGQEAQGIGGDVGEDLEGEPEVSNATEALAMQRICPNCGAANPLVGTWCIRCRENLFAPRTPLDPSRPPKRGTGETLVWVFCIGWCIGAVFSAYTGAYADAVVGFLGSILFFLFARGLGTRRREKWENTVRRMNNPH